MTARTIDLRVLDARMADALPRYVTPGSAGLDLRACLDAPLVLAPGQAELIATGIALHIGDPGLGAIILARSGRCKRRAMATGNSSSWTMPRPTAARNCLPRWQRTTRASDRSH